MIRIHGFEVDPDLARIYQGTLEATYVGPDDEWEYDDGDEWGCDPAMDVSERLARATGTPWPHVVEAMRVAVAEVGDPRVALGALVLGTTEAL